MYICIYATVRVPFASEKSWARYTQSLRGGRRGWENTGISGGGWGVRNCGTWFAPGMCARGSNARLSLGFTLLCLIILYIYIRLVTSRLVVLYVPTKNKFVVCLYLASEVV